MVKKKICMVLALISILLTTSSCGSGDKPGVFLDPEPSEPHDAAFRGSSYLKQMDDLKAINLAANFLKDLGETVTFQETYIEYHEAQKAAVKLSLTGGESVEYLGDYLEVRLYDSDNPEEDPCGECTVVYISQEGKALGRNKWAEEEGTADGQGKEDS